MLASIALDMSRVMKESFPSRNQKVGDVLGFMSNLPMHLGAYDSHQWLHTSDSHGLVEGGPTQENEGRAMHVSDQKPCRMAMSRSLGCVKTLRELSRFQSVISRILTVRRVCHGFLREVPLIHGLTGHRFPSCLGWHSL